jgi:hypothetical protein
LKNVRELKMALKQVKIEFTCKYLQRINKNQRKLHAHVKVTKRNGKHFSHSLFTPVHAHNTFLMKISNILELFDLTMYVDAMALNANSSDRVALCLRT